jgi:hypothetical protein
MARTLAESKNPGFARSPFLVQNEAIRPATAAHHHVDLADILTRMKGTLIMLRPMLLLVIVGASIMAGCASMNGESTAASSEDKAYVTGSRIAVKDKAMVPPDTDKNTINTIYQRSQVCVGGGACGGKD